MKTIVENLMHIRKAMDTWPPSGWHEVSQSIADWLMGNLRCYRDLWCNGEKYKAVGYGTVAYHITKEDKWFVHPKFHRTA